ncbi:MAG: hypothetical protein ACRDD7_08925 [Peptostreptococcaceae bacterium]
MEGWKYLDDTKEPVIVVAKDEEYQERTPVIPLEDIKFFNSTLDNLICGMKAGLLDYCDIHIKKIKEDEYKVKVENVRSL